jgi:hypothetical protein
LGAPNPARIRRAKIQRESGAPKSSALSARRNPARFRRAGIQRVSGAPQSPRQFRPAQVMRSARAKTFFPEITPVDFSPPV